MPNMVGAIKGFGSSALNGVSTAANAGHTFLFGNKKAESLVR